MARISEISQMFGGAAAAPSSATQAAWNGAVAATSSSTGAASTAPAGPAGGTGVAPAGGAAPAGDGATAPSGVQVDRFARDVLARVGAPATDENMKVLRAWVSAEGTPARFNPLATTKNMAGATSYNSVGVRNYTGYDQGLDATVATLTNGRYQPVLAALRRGDNAMAVADAIAASPWGTGGLVRTILTRGGSR